MAKPRDFLSIEQALLHALKDLTDDDLKTTKRKREEFRKFTDQLKTEYNISHRDSVEIDIVSAKKDRGRPMLKAHEAMVDKALEGHNAKANITLSLLHIGERLGTLMGVTEKALDPSSPSGSAISKEEKDNIYKAIKEVEARIASLKKAIE